MKPVLLTTLGVALLGSSLNAAAFSQPTHKRIVQDAVSYMAAHADTTEYNKLAAAAQAAGYTMEQFAEVLGQGAYDVDDFADTFICGAVSGDCVEAPVWGAGSSIAKYTSYWHFQNHTRGADAHGNDLGGYNYDLLTVWGDVDNMAATWLKGDHLDDGPGGMTGWCYWWSCNEDSEYNTYGVTEANYRQGSSSSKSMYEDFETMPFQPIDNLGQHWYNEFWNQPTVQTLGFVLHTTDLLQPHHTWTTSSLNHAGWETWVEDNYSALQLNNDALVSAALNSFTPVAAGQHDIRALLTQGGAVSYGQGGIVLSSTADADREQIAEIVIPHAIAMTVHILNHAANRF
ncbi:phospholipase [Thalassolituus sp. UBA2009]|jgi:hypothetical protein|uniref:phospholipase n=1 Tax=Thalassolituus sp. UBA2009 TaxID=1947658 RepID=UPI000C652C8B|nr:phospholipase [Thalassolituus sp. UBA2009]MAY15108.1 phospholipase [Oceanospirillaceae bacterium]